MFLFETMFLLKLEKLNKYTQQIEYLMISCSSFSFEESSTEPMV